MNLTFCTLCDESIPEKDAGSWQTKFGDPICKSCHYGIRRVETRAYLEERANRAAQKRRKIIFIAAAAILIPTFAILLWTFSNSETPVDPAKDETATSTGERIAKAHRTIRMWKADYELLSGYYRSAAYGSAATKFGPLTRGWLTELGRRAAELVVGGETRHAAVRSAVKEGAMQRDLRAAHGLLYGSGGDDEFMASARESMKMTLQFDEYATPVSAQAQCFESMLKAHQMAIQALLDRALREQGLKK